MNKEEIIDGIKNGNRRSLSKAITIIESSSPKDFELADFILTSIEQNSNSIRIGISGVPGVGKSTFIESFGMYLISLGKKVAVLAVDPTSPITGGSILGDKTRMTELAQNYSAFIRPSPSSGSLGGVARKTKDTILLCEAAGYDVILVETVGVGQSEIAVESMTDFFLLLLLANAGDELQGIKKGIMEIADMILINKADGNNYISAVNAKTEFENALRLFKPKYSFWSAPVMNISSIEKKGLDETWKKIHKFDSEFIKNKIDKRIKQNQEWLWTNVKNQIEQELNLLKSKDNNFSKIEKNFQDNKISLHLASQKIIQEFKNLQ